MTALTRFRLAGYARSHRAFQPLLLLFVVISLLYATGVPLGNELTSYADSAAILIPVFAWAARGLLDTEPDEQRMIARTAVGPAELVSGLVAALVCNAVLAGIAVVWPLVAGFQAVPGVATLVTGIGLHGLAVLAGTVLGALTSRTILPSPAISIVVLIGGYVAMLMVGSSSVWAAFPAMSWMHAANHGELAARLPVILVSAGIWVGAGLLGYAGLRRTRP
ncbi:hypothetical protein Aph01nite_58390 [Acrocarpospora phusangensis]|uniref:Uncharacterized protein n=1 Tax=Acrocarpospora phusangensis TaxID=1070424 RepID=A0A919UN36_9ACTN|nr:hypothetical protein [Acrocarpospora phusangensis]GIH27529.1 hypothetical protein Aph01nite_58390 [Acrocarpospora phusangensis]